MPKVCSKQRCKRLTEGIFLICQKCRYVAQKSRKKREEKTAIATARDGFKYCKRCCREFPLSHFHSTQNRRKKLTSRCATCRVLSGQVVRKAVSRKNSTVGKCKQMWLKWKKQSCELCGYQGDCIEADHRPERGEKIHTCSNYYWWACNGGVSALETELKKCRPLCTFCHRLVSKQDYGKGKKKCRRKKGTYVNKIKLNIGACELCKRKVTENQCCAFDFDHVDTSTKITSISQMVADYPLKKFFNCVDSELAKCRLLCAICHRNHTNTQKKQKRLELKNLLESEENKIC